MYDYIDKIRPYIMVSIGSLAGALLRIKVINLFHLNHRSNLKAIFTVNITSIFLLGLFVGFENKNSYINNSIYLLTCVGFLGSLGTFSSFISELYRLLIKGKFVDFIVQSIVFTFLGILFAYLGYFLGNF